jgi:glycosyltransferase involved in cell wall biosynthesis
MAKKPFISVIVPAYNEEEFLDSCLTSLENQTLKSKEYEIIVVNNNSTDKTAQIAKKHNVKLLFEKKRSVVTARQKGVDKSKGELIVSADADSIYPKFWLEKIKKSFDEQPEIIAVVGWIYFTNSTMLFNVGNSLNQQLNLLLFSLTGKFPLVFAANFAYWKWALYEIGGYPTHLPELGDQQYLLFRFQKLGNVIIKKSAYCFTSGRKHKSSIKNLFIYNGWNRIVGYMVNRLFRREIIGPSPAIRKSLEQKPRYKRIKLPQED